MPPAAAPAGPASERNDASCVTPLSAPRPRGGSRAYAPPSPRANGMIPALSEVPEMAYFDLDPLLETMLDAAPGISDLNLSVGRPPQVEADCQLHPVRLAGSEP